MKTNRYASVNASCAQSPPPPGYCGAFARLVCPGGGALGTLSKAFLSDARQPEVRPSPFLYALTLTNLYC